MLKRWQAVFWKTSRIFGAPRCPGGWLRLIRSGLSRGAAGPAVRTGTGASCSQGDERTIREIGDIFTIHWSNADAPKLGALWTEGGDRVHPDGLIERTRDVIITNRVAMFARREFRGSKHPLTLTMIHCVTGDVAVADGRWEPRKAADEAGKPLPAVEEQVTLVVKRAGSGWLIDAYRYTLKATAAKTPTFLKRPGWPGNPGG